MLTNRKSANRRGKVQLVDARGLWTKMRKSLGDKRKTISEAQAKEIVELYAGFTDGERVKIFPNEAFGFQRITVERPLQLRWEITDETLTAVEASKPVAVLEPEAQLKLLDALGRSRGTVLATEAEVRRDLLTHLTEAGLTKPPQYKPVLTAIAVPDSEAPVITNRVAQPEPDPDLRDNENVPLPAVQVHFEADFTARLACPDYRQAVESYLEREVRPWVPDAWVDHAKTKVGYEIPLTRHFYRYTPPRRLSEIDAEIKQLEAEIQALLADVTE